MIEHIKENDETLAVIIRNSYCKDGISFCTQDNFSQQLAYMKHPAGKIIEPHVHNSVKREIYLTKEVLFMKKGKLRVDFYNDNRDYIESIILQAGDTILLASGGHGFEVLEETEMIEVKQGPYLGEMDKTRFIGVDKSYLKLKE